MGTITPTIFKSRLPKTKRWALSYADIESAFMPFIVDDVQLDVSFSGRDSDFRLVIWGGTWQRSQPSGVELITVRYVPPTLTSEFRGTAHLPDDHLLIRSVVYPIMRSLELSESLRREMMREALHTELKTIAEQAGTMWQRCWEIQLGACPDPVRIDSLVTVWTGIRQEETLRRTVRLLTDAPAAGHDGQPSAAAS